MFFVIQEVELRSRRNDVSLPEGAEVVDVGCSSSGWPLLVVRYEGASADWTGKLFPATYREAVRTFLVVGRGEEHPPGKYVGRMVQQDPRKLHLGACYIIELEE